MMTASYSSPELGPGMVVRSGDPLRRGWLLAGWRPLRPSNGYFLHMPHTADSLKRMKDIEKNPEAGTILPFSVFVSWF